MTESPTYVSSMAQAGFDVVTADCETDLEDAAQSLKAASKGGNGNKRRMNKF